MANLAFFFAWRDNELEPHPGHTLNRKSEASLERDFCRQFRLFKRRRLPVALHSVQLRQHPTRHEVRGELHDTCSTFFFLFSILSR